jgi:hypothetical protein
MGWQRFNRTSNIFEVSDNNGASWLPLAIAPAGLAANVAYKDINNNFVGQTIGSGSTFYGSSAHYYLFDPGSPVNARYWRFITYNGATDFRVECLPDNLASIQSTPILMQRSGDVSIGRDIYEKGRGLGLGHWTTVAFNAANFSSAAGSTWTVTSGQILLNKYTLIGKTLTWTCIIYQSTITGTPTNVYINIPAGLSGYVYGGMARIGHTAISGSPKEGMVYVDGLQSRITASIFGGLTAGPFDLWFTITLEIQ